MSNHFSFQEDRRLLMDAGKASGRGGMDGSLRGGCSLRMIHPGSLCPRVAGLVSRLVRVRPYFRLAHLLPVDGHAT